MKRILSPSIFLFPLSVLVLLTACAPAKKLLRDPDAAKCYVVDSTKYLSREDHARLFQGVESEGHSFPPCDSAKPGVLRIQPRTSNLASPTASYILTGVDLATFGTGIGMVVATQQPAWILLSLLQLSPTGTITYRAEYADAKGKTSHTDFLVSKAVWFKGREDSKPILVEHSRRELSKTLFGKEYPSELEHAFGRASLDVIPALLSFTGIYEGALMVTHFEKFLPGNYTVAVSPAVFLPFSKPRYVYMIHAGPRRYFTKGYSGLFVGLEPYLQADYDHGLWYSVAALPVTFGSVFQGKRFVSGIDIGLGPSVDLKGDYGGSDYIFMLNLHWGFAF